MEGYLVPGARLWIEPIDGHENAGTLIVCRHQVVPSEPGRSIFEPIQGQIPATFDHRLEVGISEDYGWGEHVWNAIVEFWFRMDRGNAQWSGAIGRPSSCPSMALPRTLRRNQWAYEGATCSLGTH
jgi:hypothetical protein